jgi:hypothetical protein
MKTLKRIFKYIIKLFRNTQKQEQIQHKERENTQMKLKVEGQYFYGFKNIRGYTTLIVTRTSINAMNFDSKAKAERGKRRIARHMKNGTHELTYDDALKRIKIV